MSILVEILTAVYAAFFIIFVSIFFNQKNRKEYFSLKIIIFFIFLFFLFMLSNHLFSYEVKMIATTLFIILYQYFYFKISLLESFIKTIIFLFIMAFSDLFTGMLLIYFVEIEPSLFKTSLFYINLYHSVMFSIIFFVTLITSKLWHRKFIKNKKSLGASSDFLLIVFSLTMILTIILYAIILKEIQVVNYKLMVFILLLIIIFSIVNLFVVYLYNRYLEQKIMSERQELEYKQLQTYTTSVEGILKDLKKNKHDYLNVLLSLKGILEVEQNTKNAIDYLNNILKEEQKIIEEDKKMYEVLKLIQSPSIQGFLRIKISKALNSNLKVSIIIPENILFNSINIVDLVKIFGILLDNAIEAAEISDDKLFMVTIRKEPEKIKIIVTNSYKDAPDIQKIYTEGYSTKGNNRGFGLSNVRQIIDDKYDNIKLFSYIDNNLFIQQLDIYDK